MLNTENALFIAKDALVQVRQAHMQGLVSLFNALGGGWTNTPTDAPKPASVARRTSRLAHLNPN